MAKGKPHPKAQSKHEHHQHLPKVGSPAQHKWDDHARDDNIGFASKWVGAAIAIIVVITVIAYFFWSKGQA